MVITRSKNHYAKIALAVTLALFVGADSFYSERCTTEPKAIFSGITYGCELLERTDEGHELCWKGRRSRSVLLTELMDSSL